MSVRKAVCVNTAVYARMGRYADAMGLRIEQATEAALNEWFELFGESRLERHMNRRSQEGAKVLTMASRGT